MSIDRLALHDDRPRAIAITAIVILLALPGCSGGSRSPAPEAEPISTDLAVQTFDSAWSRINTSYYDPEFRGIDWEGVRDELRPEAARSETQEALRGVLGDMLSRLGESHFAILPGARVDAIQVGEDGTGEASGSGEGDLGIEVRWVEGALTVFRVAEGPARAAGVQPGWIIDAIGDRSMAEWAEIVEETEAGRARISVETETMQGAHQLFRGGVGSSLDLTFIDGEGDRRELTLERTPVRGEMIRFGGLPAMTAWLDHERIERPDGSCAGVITFNVWMLPLVPSFNQAVDALEECAGIVIDLRGNPGGVGGMVMSTAGSFFSERAELGTLHARTGELDFVAMPRRVDSRGELRDAFDGRLAVLVDQMSMSTSEIFAAGLASTGRARLFGQTTPGYALPAMTLRLPNRDVLYHVVSNLTDPEGVRIEGLGVRPDVEIPLRRRGLLAGRDEVLDAAVAWATGGARP
ncbi:MAG: S41 family peptidase [Longimicrobiales bacterium]|nr:S41 family peptidase [Longimicrobiales bacterium]